MGANIGGNSEWYFYNARLKSSGASQFRRVWGNRPLEDNWRRANKVSAVISTAEEGSDGEISEREQEDEENVVPAHHKPEYYLANIPATEEQKATSNAMIADAMFAMATIYDEKLADYPMAIATYSSFLERFGYDDRSLESTYALYRTSKKLGDEPEADRYRQQIIKLYPESKYAAMEYTAPTTRFPVGETYHAIKPFSPLAFATFVLLSFAIICFFLLFRLL